MTTTTRELAAANDTLRADFPTALIVDAAFHANGFHLTMIPKEINQDSHVGRGATVEDALDDLRAKIAAHDPLAKLRKEWIAAGRPPLDQLSGSINVVTPPSNLQPT